MTFRAIPNVDLEGAAVPPKRGTQPGGVIWVKAADLVVDTRYQRDLGPRGVGRVRDIALGFDWRKFTPIIVARVSGRGFAVIDGQHRAAAVLARGDIKEIPAWVIDADVAGQADTFLTLNAEGARVPAGCILYARAASGDKKAKAVLSLCEDAGIELLKYAVSAQVRRFDQAISPVEIQTQLKGQGRPVVLRALKVLRSAGEMAGRCFLTQRMICAVVLLCKFNPQWPDDAFAISLRNLRIEEAESQATIKARDAGGTRQEHFIAIVRAYVVERIGGKVAA